MQIVGTMEGREEDLSEETVVLLGGTKVPWEEMNEL